ncbi:transposase [Pseudomonadota bacterium]
MSRYKEQNVQGDHSHLLAKAFPKMSISILMGVEKGKTAIQMSKSFPCFVRS